MVKNSMSEHMVNKLKKHEDISNNLGFITTVKRDNAKTLEERIYYEIILDYILRVSDGYGNLR